MFGVGRLHSNIKHCILLNDFTLSFRYCALNCVCVRSKAVGIIKVCYNTFSHFCGSISCAHFLLTCFVLSKLRTVITLEGQHLFQQPEFASFPIYLLPTSLVRCV